MHSQLIIRHATVVDGTGSPGYRADVRLRDGRVAEIARGGLPTEAPGTVIDATDLVVAPGFIDMHAHSELSLLRGDDHLAKITQGVTLEIVGQDGLGYAPVTPASLASIGRQIAGWNGPVPEGAGWTSLAEFLDALADGGGLPNHVAALVPQGNLRHLVIGTEDRQATPAEIRRMCEILAEGFDQGAVGMSSGLSYAPGMYASTEELAALCDVVASYGGYYAPHTRSYGHRALESYAEMIGIAASTGCSLHLTHATMNFPENADRADRLIRLVDEALDAGCDVTLDSYPYLPGATTLAALLPSWVFSGGPDGVLARLSDAGDLRRIRDEIEQTGSDGCHGVPVDWATVQIASVGRAELESAVGATIEELATRRGTSQFAVFVDTLIDDQLSTGILQHVGHEENVRLIMRHRVHTGGSDGILVGGRPHPRAWGTFARYLGRYARDLGVLGLEECVAHLSGRPAARLRLADRGLVREGFVADLVMFDPDAVADGATFDEPRRPATGIRHVLVGGVPVVSEGRTTGATPGQVLKFIEGRTIG